jgi:SAM-dependent methyltransferase
VHAAFVFERRVTVLTDRLAAVVPKEGRMLDVGAGDGTIAARLQERLPELEIEGIDVLVRDATRIPVRPFDGVSIPHGDDEFDAVLLVDVLHHADAPHLLLAECARVARSAVIVKDHVIRNRLDHATLAFMDRVGNRRHGVALRYEYWTRAQWDRAFATSGLEVVTWRSALGLYPAPASFVFERSLHFVAVLRPVEGRAAILASR